MASEYENMYKHQEEARPTKRRRTGDYSPPCRQMILGEIDLELALRQRLSETIQSRIDWALLLRESLEAQKDNDWDGFIPASMDALEAIEAPCNVIFDRETRIAPPPRPPPPDLVAPPSLPAPEPSESMHKRTGRTTRTRGLARLLPATPKRLLFLRNTTTSPPEIAKLACAVCARSDFSNLQGLLNHCRLRHKIEFGSHDECVQSCAVLVSEAERDWVVANGIELGGIGLPSLRRMFEIAVGAGDSVRLPLPSKSTVAQTTPEQADTPDSQAVTEESLRPPPAPQASSHATRTLGYHVDTPALAAFLGRAPKTRCINVYGNEDDIVDVRDMSGGSGLHLKHTWRKTYAPRNVARRELDDVVLLPDAVNDDRKGKSGNHRDAQPEDPTSTQVTRNLQDFGGSRFHIMARVQIADYSLYIPPNRRLVAQPDHTHRWRLAVTSPSYSLPISSVLSKVTIASLTDPPPSTITEPIALTKSPFVITSTTDRPFLAHLTFTWAGSMNAPMKIEHWVELDAMHYPSAVLGDQQVFDAELDRHTELLPVREDVREVSWDVEQIAGNEPAYAETKAEEVEAEPSWAVKLRSLLPQYPMTMNDAKRRLPAQFPYTLVSTPEQFQNLIHGRRKALEMARSRALRDAYASSLSQAEDAEATPLTTVDVFHWLDNEGLFPRDLNSFQQHKPSTARNKSATIATFCRACGLQRAYHPTLREDSQPRSTDVKPPASISAAASGLAKDTFLQTRTQTQPFCMSFREDVPETMRPFIDVHALVARNKLSHTRSATDAIASAATTVENSLLYGLCPAIFAPTSPRPVIVPIQAEIALCPGDLVALADPQLVVAIRRMTGLPFHLRPHAQTTMPDAETTLATETSNPSFAQTHSPLCDDDASLTLTHLTRSTLDTQLGPSALLALSLRALVRKLVSCGVEALHRDEAALRVGSAARRHRHERMRRVAVVDSPRRVLAPTHVLEGLARHSRTDVADSALWLCFARLGERSSESRAGA